MKIVFFTDHIVGSPRKATVPLFADNLAALGWNVYMITVGYSWLTIIKGDSRHSYARTIKPNVWIRASKNLKGYLMRRVLNPSRLPFKFLNILGKPFFKWYYTWLPKAVKEKIKDADTIVIESGPGLMLVPLLRQILPNVRLVYMVSDRLETLRVNPVISDAEKQYLQEFDLIVALSPLVAADFNHSNCHFIPQGVDKDLFDNINSNPFNRTNNIVSVGDMLFHGDAVLELAKRNPTWTIHLFGDKAKCKEELPNIITHGETPFLKILPYIKFADIGLAPYRPVPGVEYISQSSLKLKQYTYVRLPIIAPNFASSFYSNIASYDPFNLETVQDAFSKAITINRNNISIDGIKSWPEVTAIFLELLKTSPHGIMSRRPYEDHVNRQA